MFWLQCHSLLHKHDTENWENWVLHRRNWGRKLEGGGGSSLQDTRKFSGMGHHDSNRDRVTCHYILSMCPLLWYSPGLIIITYYHHHHHHSLILFFLHFFLGFLWAIIITVWYRYSNRVCPPFLIANSPHFHLIETTSFWLQIWFGYLFQ